MIKNQLWFFVLMGIYRGRVDVLEKYDYTAAVMRRNLETALKDESAQINGA